MTPGASCEPGSTGTGHLKASWLLYFPLLLLTHQHQASLPWELLVSSDLSHFLPLEGTARAFGHAPALPQSIFLHMGAVAQWTPS